ncbi:hypothetical protein G3N56_06250 [Desulfovibrio sulfodismutans]|uniref:Uncharacterized protein n=1 Tax=Desulfolutivibrio sulfodismutans TaxID=63561 RepID=A0A7K3NJG8_9BACT|nr:hypothetical protein [Desulfolutivibrio sulfodismutans]NDY56344.1 hypothetical protein [Desulfolutivibrio sulfodismutans]QLA11533.1 hypothetical protein GD606_04195 [Desulfolutivibrio sulfodismutans DSM 3696]QLA14171.1 hypothetical protein GD606_18820 [Desulfolutivibrio sulfodismutans DSM 3696]
MADLIYTDGKRRMLAHLAGQPLKIMLLGAGYEPDAAHAVLADVAAHEIVGEGYAAGGQALQNLAAQAVGAGAILAADAPLWPDSSISARYAVVYDATEGGDGPLLRLFDFTELKTSDGGPFEIVFDATGAMGLA